MSEDELRAIEARWSGGAHVGVEQDHVAGTMTVRVPYASDVPTLIAEVRRLQGEVDSTRADLDKWQSATRTLRARLDDAERE